MRQEIKQNLQRQRLSRENRANKDSQDNKPNGRRMTTKESDNKDNKAEGKKQNKVQDKPAPKQTRLNQRQRSKPVEITSEEENFNP